MTYSKLPKPFFVLAPMDDVTDTVFRQVVSDLAAPDIYFTEFVNVDALCSPGRDATMIKLKYTEAERPLIAQVWGKNPENYYQIASELVEMGFDGIDINMGCPQKNVVGNGCCIALSLPENRSLADEIIKATQEGAGGKLPVSVKTRLGYNEIDHTWTEFLLQRKLDVLSIHARTKKEMSKVPAHWEDLDEIVHLRDKLAPDTLIVGNGDVMSREQGLELASKHRLDGVMIGRGIFHDPFVFSKKSPWAGYTKQQKIDLFAEHVKLFAKTWKHGERNIRTLNRFCKIYINGFDGAKELREKLMQASSTDELLKSLT